MARRGAAEQPEADASPLLDEAEQEAVVAAFSKQAASQALLWRRLFSTLGFCLACTFAYFATSQARQPWQLSWHAAFYGLVPAPWTVLADGATAFSFAAASHALHRQQHAALRLSQALCVAAGLLWAWPLLLLARSRAQRPSGFDDDSLLTLLWLPAAAPAFAAVCASVEHGASGTLAAVEALRKTQYAYKTA